MQQQQKRFFIESVCIIIKGRAFWPRALTHLNPALVLSPRQGLYQYL